MRYFFAATICFIQFLGYSVAQIDTLVPLPTIELSAPRLRVDHPAHAAWDSLELRWLPGANLADLLSQHSGAYVRSYGQGSLATLRVRGAAAEQSTVLWNGLPISSPALGLNDLALLPVFLIDEARLIPGGQSALWGSGAVGGSLQLNNAAPPSGHRLRLGAGLGSFGWQQQYLQYSFGTQKLQSSTRLLHQAARNDFPYKLGSEQRRQSHAETAQWLALQECYFRPDDRHQLVMRLWGQFTDRAIPPTTVQTRSGADQEDRFLRGSLHWTHQRRLGIWQARLGVFREHTFYSDTLTGETAPSDFLILQGEVEYQREFRRLGRFNFGSHWQNAQATTTGYSDGREQSRLAFFGNWR
ncbi:MAG: TonB-dependent receptor plug domain-containing protein, partial [Lewinella sp.]|nr:TonB-dependent receptor plug domain-containing protein [Lewinella sp.]